MEAATNFVPGFTLEGLETWLLSLDPDTQVGFRRRCNRCPIARFLTYLTDRVWDVGDKTISGFPGTTTFQTPRWASMFINSVDLYKSQNVTAKGALRTLQSVKKRLEKESN